MENVAEISARTFGRLKLALLAVDVVSGRIKRLKFGSESFKEMGG